MHCLRRSAQRFCGVSLLSACCMVAADATARFVDSTSLEDFLLPSDAERIEQSFKSVFRVDQAGVLVSAGAKLGPAYASKVAEIIPYEEFREAYRDLAKYLDMFGPCQKKQMRDASGWWSKYADNPGDDYCREITKLVAATMFWNQAHYCVQLVAGEVEPKVPGSTYGPRPWRLDQTPVKTEWLNADTLYALADAALGRGGDKLLERHAASAPNVKIRVACTQALSELRKENPNRELTALALAKLVARRYEALHLDHLANKVAH